MNYTNRLKLEITAGILWGAGLIATLLLISMDKLDATPAIIIFVILNVFYIAMSYYTERKWYNLWKIPAAHIAIYFSAAALILVLMFCTHTDDYWGCYLIALIAGNHTALDIRSYKNAVRYNMNDIGSIEELVEKHPETRGLLNEKYKSKIET